MTGPLIFRTVTVQHDDTPFSSSEPFRKLQENVKLQIAILYLPVSIIYSAGG